ncbi:alpha/beta hydrolase [Glaciimonas soli]|uniref:Alpha/beta fold hydrolase n=1 Tax=Glaciimonas soli TaxID=2590999 RepID=A0A843YIL4_9BURK|nr:alpha/beta hydrolase [Glaciimonas soli]MQQ99194.1 alpha/beta fold hydrolase [Glaciimonas soli]
MKLLIIIGVIFLGLVTAITLAITLGGPGNPPPMSSINDPFSGVDYSDLPAPRQFTARDGAKLSFREYQVANGLPKGSVVLIHGSSASGKSMHQMAKAFAAAGYTAFALDVRGHGGSGTKGYIDYVGQLENDLEDFSSAIKPQKPATLAGFSSGGGFVLRFAGSAKQQLFSNYLLLSPFIGLDSPTSRPNSGGWVSVGVPRLIAVSALNAIGVRTFNHLPVIKFALSEEAKSFLTPQYSYALLLNFGPERDWRANIRAVRQPLFLVAGQSDEAFHADLFSQTFKAEGKDIPVTLIPGIGHIALTLDPTAIQAAISAVKSMDASLK